MQNTNPIENNRDTLLLLLVTFLCGVIIGLLIAPGRRQSTHSPANEKNLSRHTERRRVNDHRQTRAANNFVFGNIVIGSNNGQENSMTFGLDDSSGNRS